MSSAPKVAVGFPFRREWEGVTAVDVFALGIFSAPHVMLAPITSWGTYIERNRNAIVKQAMSLGIAFDFLLQIDSDMRFPPDSLLRLIAANKDIVGANYRQRDPPYGYAGIYEDKTDTHLLEPGLHRMLQMPTGLLLTKFDLFRQIPPQWFRQPPEDNEDGGRDDVYFCRKAIEYGYEVWCDNDLTKQVRHMGEQEIPWFSPEQLGAVPPKEGFQVISRGAYIKSQEAAEEDIAASRRYTAA